MSEELQESTETIETNEQDNAGLNADDTNDDTAGSENNDEDGKQDPEKNNEIYGSPESYDYSEVQLPENMTLDEEMLEKFNPIAKELNLSNKSANRLMNLAVELTQKNSAKFVEEITAQIQDAESKQYMQMLNTDEELNAYSDEEYSQYLSTANLGIKSVATQGFKDLLKAKGLTNHPEFIKTFHAIGKLCKNDSLPDVKNPVGSTQSAADILYGSKES